MGSSKFWLTSVICLSFTAGLFFFAKNSFQTNIEISFSESATLLSQSLRQKLKRDLSQQLGDYSSQSIWSVPLDSVLQSILSDSRVESATIRRQFPNKVELQVLPVQPRLLLLGLKGKLHPVAQDGRLMPPLHAVESPDLPVLRGLGFFKNEEHRKQIVKLFLQLPEEGKFSRSQVSEIRRNKKGETELFMNEYDHRVLLGESLDKSLVSRVEQVMTYLESRSIKSRVIDARFSKKVVVRVRNAP